MFFLGSLIQGIMSVNKVKFIARVGHHFLPTARKESGILSGTESWRKSELHLAKRH
jgi:hypothetical protein